MLLRAVTFSSPMQVVPHVRCQVLRLVQFQRALIHKGPHAWCERRWSTDKEPVLVRRDVHDVGARTVSSRP
jgi:hypothetical protein